MAATDWEAAGKAWWKNVEYLASDELEGRNVGSPGYEKAATYVAAQFERAGLKPAGTDNYFQPVAIHRNLARSLEIIVYRWFVKTRPSPPSLFPKRRNSAIPPILPLRSKLPSYLPATAS